jgi:hypothetical protein
MSRSSGRIAWLTLWLLIAVAAGVGLVILFGKPESPVVIAPPTSQPATQPAIATIPSTQPPIIQTYGQLLHADLPNYPDTRPWAVPVDLNDAAHLILNEPMYICSRGDLWITRSDADPLPIVLARAANESEHIVDRPIEYIVWSINRRWLWEASAICRAGDGFQLISAKDAISLPWHRSYRWDLAMTWADNAATHLIVPTDTGVSIMTLGNPPSEDYCPLLDSAATSRQSSQPPMVMFDLRGLLAWIPAEGDFNSASRVARYLDGKWSYLDSTAWPGDIIHLVPMLDGSVLQIRRGSDLGGANLTIVPLDAAQIDEKEIAGLTDQLSDDDPDKRVAAYQRLIQYGPGIYSILEKLSPNAAPEAQARIREILEGKLATKLGGMLVNDNLLTVAARLRDGGVVFLAPHGVTIPQEGQDPKVISPDYLAVRPGQPVQELPAVVVDRLAKSGGTIAGWRDEWAVTTPNAGPARYLPPNQLQPLLRPAEQVYSNFLAIDSRGRWIFQDPISHRTLILDPTVPDPTPRLAIWLIDTGNGVGWNKADWPVIQRGTAHWVISEQDWQPLDPTEEMQIDFVQTSFPLAAATIPTSAPATAPASVKTPQLLIDADGNRYFGGQTALTILTHAGKRFDWPLPDTCAGSADQIPWLVSDRQGHLFLFNSTGRIARIRATPGAAEPFVLEAVFSEHVPDFQNIRRIWCDPAGRIAVAYESSHLALIFPTGQVPPEIEDKILPQDLRRIDGP